MQILYLDLFSGISGDMTLSALVDLGADPKKIQSELEKLLPSGEHFHIRFTEVIKCGVKGLKFHLDAPFPKLSHSTFASISKQIKAAGFSTYVTDKALAIFEVIAIAEGKIHHLPVEKVHFHEVGAMDSLVDILGVCIALEQLKPGKIMASPVALGHGVVECQHGSYPVPAMASLEILKGVPIRPSNQPFELTTPTGAGFLKVLVEEFSSSLPAMEVEKIGYGAGSHELNKQPNILRAITGRLIFDEAQQHATDQPHDHQH